VQEASQFLQEGDRGAAWRIQSFVGLEVGRGHFPMNPKNLKGLKDCNHCLLCRLPNTASSGDVVKETELPDPCSYVALSHLGNIDWLIPICFLNRVFSM